MALSHFLFVPLVGFIGSLLLLGCASSPSKSELATEVDSLKKQLHEMHSRLDAVELRNAAASSQENHRDQQNNANRPVGAVDLPPLEAVRAHPVQGEGTAVDPKISDTDPESGFVIDASVISFRQAMVLFRSQKFSEAILAFSAFIENYPDHPMAGSAQFYIGECYLKEKEYKLATQEFERTLSTYERSSHISDALKDLAWAEDQLKLTEEAAKHRQLLTSVFPQSPAAKSLAQTTSVAQKSEPLEPLESRGEKAEPTANQSEPTSEKANPNLDLPPPTAPIPEGH